MNVTLRPEAEADVEDAARWYEQQRPGLGAALLDEVIHTIDRIGENPQGYPCVHGEIRRALTHRFPFGIFYVPDNEGIVILAVMHASRHPTKWKKRT